LGPENSATRLVAEAILRNHGFDSASIRPTFLSISDMASRLHDGDIDMGFFVSYVPGEALKSVLNSSNIKLLSLGQNEVAPLTRTVFTTTAIRPGTYASQREGEPAIQTLATRAVLVTTESGSRDIEKVAEAVVEGAAYLGLAADSMAQELQSLPLHPDAKRYYQKAEFLPTEPQRFFSLTSFYQVLAILVILFTAYKGLMIGLLKWRRDTTFNDVSRRTLGIHVEADIERSIQALNTLRDEVQDRVRRRWWQPGELDKKRWRYMYDLIQDRIWEAKDNLARALVIEIRSVAADPTRDDREKRDHLRSVESRVWEYFESGILEASQREMLIHAMRSAGMQETV
jgi:hypothetical protein